MRINIGGEGVKKMRTTWISILILILLMLELDHRKECSKEDQNSIQLSRCNFTLFGR